MDDMEQFLELDETYQRDIAELYRNAFGQAPWNDDWSDEFQLMEYIKEIDNQYRMELLEIMESGLQYEKTRGNMKETVIEKVEKVFEGH